jgi:signal peptidase I
MSLKPRLTKWAWELVVPAVAAFFVVHWLLPSRMEGASGGLWAHAGQLATDHPLLIALLLFVALSETVRYWRTRAGYVSVAAPKERRVGRFVVSLVGLVAVALLLRARVVETSHVVGPSMLPTLKQGDRVLVNELAYVGGKLPRRGDLVVFKAGTQLGGSGPQSLVKRVVGVPGDRMAFQQGRLFINEWPVPNCDAGPYANVLGTLSVRGRVTVEFLDGSTYLTIRTPGERAFSSYTVKPGEVFVIGDDRGMSSDSRVWNEGRGAGVPVSAIEGKVARILVGGRRDGKLDLTRAFASLGSLRVDEQSVDVRKLEGRIASCLKDRPASTSPPAGSVASR